MSFVAALLLLGIGFFVAFAIGSNDETMSPAVGAGIFTVGMAVTLGALINIIGAVLLGKGVSEKVGKDLITSSHQLDVAMILAILLAMSIWLISVSVGKGLPISTTQAVVGCVVGLALFKWGINGVNHVVFFEIVIGWLISPIIGFIGSFIFYRIILMLRDAFIHQENLIVHERVNRIAAYFLALFLIITSLSRGGNDVANAMAPLIGIQELLGIQQLSSQVVLLVGGLGMASGLILIGRKVVRTLSTEVIDLSPLSALSASLSVSLIMFFGTLAGLPLSGSHILVAALIGVGWAERTRIQRDSIVQIAISWLVTLPASALLAIMLYVVMNPIISILMV